MIFKKSQWIHKDNKIKNNADSLGVMCMVIAFQSQHQATFLTCPHHLVCAVSGYTVLQI